MLGALFRTMAPFAPRAPPGTSPAPLWGSEAHVRGLFGDRVEWQSMKRDVLTITAFSRPTDFGDVLQGPLRPDDRRPRQGAERQGRAEEFDAALDAFCDEWNLGTADEALFEMEYLLAIGLRT